MLNSLMCLVTLVSVPSGLAAWQTTLRGTFVDSITGNPIGAVRVVVSPIGIEAVSTSDGSFAVGPLPPGAYEIQFEIHRYRARAFAFEVDTLTVHDHDLGRVPLAPAESLLFDISGFVGDAATTIPGAVVSVNDHVLGITNLDGAFAGQLRLPAGLNVVQGRTMGFAAATEAVWATR